MSKISNNIGFDALLSFGKFQSIFPKYVLKNKMCHQKSFHLLKHRESCGQMNTQQHPLAST